MKVLRIASWLASAATSFWIGWKIASLDDRLDEAEEEILNLQPPKRPRRPRVVA